MNIDLEDFTKLPEVSWPEKGDELFSKEGDRRMNVCTSISANNLSVYSEGYKRAADIIIDSLEDYYFEINFLFHPVLYLYRHHIELTLKSIIGYANILEECDNSFPRTHDLSILWMKARDKIKIIGDEIQEDDLKAVDDLIAQFADFDPLSTTFRYPIDSKGEPSIKNHIILNLSHFKSVIEKLSAFLECVVSAFSDYVSDVSHEY